MENNYLFPLGTFERIREQHSLIDQVKAQKQIQHLTQVVAGYKAYFTKKRRARS